MTIRNTSSTGALMAFGSVLMLLLMIGTMIGMARNGNPIGVHIVDHGYTPETAAALNRNNCTTYAMRNDTALVGVNCQSAWRPTFDYSLAR